MDRGMADKVPGPHPQAAFRVVDGEGVMVLARDGQIQVLNEVGARVYELVDGQRTIGSIAEIIVAEFNVGKAEAMSDVSEFVKQLVDGNAAVWVEAE